MHYLPLKLILLTVLSYQRIWFLQAQEIDVNATEVISSGTNVVTGVVENIPNAIPPAEQIVMMPIQLAMGLPIAVLFNVINQLCAIALATGHVESQVTPDIRKINFELRKPCARITVPILNAEELWIHPEFNSSRPVVIVVSGWTTNVNVSDMQIAMAKAYNCRDDNNFLALDAARFIDTLYTWSTFNTQEIGHYLAVGLVKLGHIVPISRVHLIGHSLGAHIVGAAARYYHNMTGVKLERITGLDPASPCFNSGHSLEPIGRGDAEFVDIIHSNPSVLGMWHAVGDAEFYPNGYQPLQPGCFIMDCSHERSWQYYAKTVYPNNERNFPTRECSSLTALLGSYCLGPQIPMGYAVPHDLNGQYFLEVNGQEPYGKNASSEYQWADGECGSCNLDDTTEAMGVMDKNQKL